MFRHTALFVLRPTTTAAQRLEMLRGLESLAEHCPTVRAIDYGEHIFGGAGAYDVALHLDFDDADGYDAYVADPGHESVSRFNASVSLADQTARVDWLPERPLSSAPGHVRHCMTFGWAEGVNGPTRDRAFDAAAKLGGAPGVVSAVVAENAGSDPRASDWVLDVEIADTAAAAALLNGTAFADAMAAVAPAITAGRTAGVTHLSR
jgi:Stress responsive A/B Barrel Domain